MPSAKRFLFLGWFLNILTMYKIIRTKKITTLHPWCTLAGAMGAILKKSDSSLTLNIDSFEPHAEAMVENKTWNKSGLKYRVLFYLEKVQAKIADNLIFAAPGMEKYIKEKYHTTPKKYFVKPACIDLEAFSNKFIRQPDLMKKYKLENKITCVYAGKFGGIYLENEVFQFIKSCENFWGKDKFRFLLLSNLEDIYLEGKLRQFNIFHSTVIKLFIPHSKVPLYMGLADFAISPIKSVATKKYCTPIKDGEYWALGLPVVITPDISTDSEIIAKNEAGAILSSLDENGYHQAIINIDAMLKEKTRIEIYNKIRPLAEKYRNFSIAESVYRVLYA